MRCPFLEIGQALINLKQGELTLKVTADQVKFNLNQSVRMSDLAIIYCMSIYSMILGRYELIFYFMDNDSMEDILFRSLKTSYLIEENSCMNP